MLNELYEFLFMTLKKSASDLVREGNMKSIIDDVYAARKGVSSVDFPEIQFGLIQIIGPLSSSSSHSKYEAVYDLQVASGSMSQRTINNLMWWLMTRIQWLNMNRGIFDYNGCQPITSITFSDATIGLRVEDSARNIVGFSSLSKIRVLINVPHSLFIPTNCDNI